MEMPIKAASRLFLTLGAIACSSLTFGQTGTSIYEGDWPVYHGNEFSQRYSPLDQINADNVGSLQIVWRFSTESFGPDTDFTNPSTPLEVDGVLYADIATTRNVIALNAVTGKVLWLWRPQEGERFEHAPRKGAGRGVAYWRDGDKKRSHSGDWLT